MVTPVSLTSDEGTMLSDGIDCPTDTMVGAFPVLIVAFCCSSCTLLVCLSDCRWMLRLPFVVVE